MNVGLIPTEEKLRTPSFTLTSHTDSSLLTRQVLRVTHYMAIISLWWTFCKNCFWFLQQRRFFSGALAITISWVFYFFPKQQECQDFLTHLCYSGCSKRRTMPSLSDLWRISKATEVIDMKKKKKTVGWFSSSPHYRGAPSLKRSPICFLSNCLIRFGIHICSVYLSFGHCVFKAFEWFLVVLGERNKLMSHGGQWGADLCWVL